jgi:integrase
VVDVAGDGRRRQKWKGGFRTRKEAERELRRYLVLLDAGGDPFPEEITLAAYTTRWLEHQRGRLRPSTHLRYGQLLTEATAVIGSLRLDRVRPAHVQQVMDRMTQRGLAPRTVIQARAVLGSAMRQAVAWGLIPVSPVQAVKPPKPERPHLEVPTAEESLRLINAAEGTMWELPLLLSATTGARRGEVLAARWGDLDLETGLVLITKAMQRVEGRLVLVEPKTARGRRQVTIPAFALDRLRLHRKEQAQRRLLIGPAWSDLDLICDRGDGGAIDPSSFTHAAKRLILQAGLPRATRLHDLRHGFATVLQMSDVAVGATFDRVRDHGAIRGLGFWLSPVAA